MQEQVIQTPEKQAWLPKLLGFDFTIKYKKGKQDQVADAISRSFMAISRPQLDFINELQQQLHHQDTHAKLPTANKSLLHHKNCLYFWKGKLLIPSSSNIRPMILKESHDLIVGGDVGFQRTLARVSAQFFFWKGLYEDVKNYVRACKA